jgi:ABC-type sugar transport system, periplasmic component
MRKKILAVLLGVAVLGVVAGCSNTNKETEEATTKDTEATGSTEAEGAGYTFGAGETFYSDEPVNYSFMYSDHENYPSKDDWLLWTEIEKLTNVKFDMTLVARTDYDDKVSALVNAGDAPYIIPKMYNEGPYANSGQVVAISDWVQYMPNYMKAVEEWGMEDDLKAMFQDDGKYYRLPHMWEKAAGGYSLIIRKDIFEAAGIDVIEAEKTWTWETFYEDLKKVKEYTGADYIWSDQYKGDASLNISSVVYSSKLGWGAGNGTAFDFDKEEFFFTNTTDSYRDLLRVFNKMYTDGILDPETFVQDSETAQSKFFRGESIILEATYQQLADMVGNDKVEVEGAELYMIVPPGGPAGQLQLESGRLESGIMITQNALDDLGEEGFIKMLRFVDWLWYSEEGQILSLWGVEGETYEIVDGELVLNEDIFYNGMNPGAPKLLNVDYGFGGGVFAVGGSVDIRFSKFTEGEMDYNNRIYENKTPRRLEPPIMSSEMEGEELNLIQTPLMDYVKTSALEFITGNKDIEADWDDYVAQCISRRSEEYVELVNEIYERTADILK